MMYCTVLQPYQGPKYSVKYSNSSTPPDSLWLMCGVPNGYRLQHHIFKTGGLGDLQVTITIHLPRYL